jgi:hypothetical protein
VPSLQDKLAKVFTEIKAVYCQNYLKPINALCKQNTRFFKDKTGDTYSNHRDVRG